MTKRIAMMMLSTIMFLGLTTMAARFAAAQSQGDKMGSGDKMVSQDNGNMASGTMSEDNKAADKMNSKTAKAKKKSGKKDKMAANAKTTDKGKMNDNSQMSDQK